MDLRTRPVQTGDIIALDGKTSRRSHDRAAGKAALHLVSAFATREKLVLGQEAVEAKSNEIKAIPRLLERLADAKALAGALVAAPVVALLPVLGPFTAIVYGVVVGAGVRSGQKQVKQLTGG